MRLRTDWSRDLLPALLLLLVMPATLSGQITDPDTPVDSPLWWTLEPAVEPAELRALHLDLLASRERYAEAVEAGLAEPLDTEALERLEFYLNGRQQPELVPMWQAFSWLARSTDLSASAEDRTRRRLEGHGVSPSGIQRILAEAHAVLQRSWSIDAQTRQATRELRQLVDRAAENGKGREARNAWRDYDAEALARATGRARRDLEQVLERARGSEHWAAAVGEKLEVLRRALDDSDWASLRHMLKHDIAPKVTSRTIRDEEETGR